MNRAKSPRNRLSPAAPRFRADPDETLGPRRERRGLQGTGGSPARSGGMPLPPPPLKVFKTHIGFYDMVVAAPSMKAAVEAWHASPRLFAQGFAAVTQEPAAVEAALAQPGTVLKRPHGRHSPYKAEPEAPAAPRPTARQKQKTAAAGKLRKQKEAAEKRARAEAARRAKAEAKNELAEIAREEQTLRQRRQALRRKFHLHAI